MTEATDAQLRRIEALQRELQELRQHLPVSAKVVQPVDLPLDALVLEVTGFAIGFPVHAVVQVAPMALVEPLPRAPAVIRGTINYRGQLVPVVDLGFALSGEHAPLKLTQFLVFLEAAARRYAVVVDGVEGVQTFTTEDIEAHAVIASLPDFVLRHFRDGERAVALLDPAGLLEASEQGVLQQLLAGLARPEGSDHDA